MKNKKIITLIILSCFSCGNQNNIESINSSEMSSNLVSSIEINFSENTSLDNSSISSIKDSEILNSSLEESNFSEESFEEQTISTVKEIKEKAKEFEGLENEVGVYESDVYVEINLKLLACLDAITTKSGYGDRYKLLMADKEDYIYVKTNYESYNYVKDYVTDQSVYSIKGYISIYNGEVEIASKEKPLYVASEIISFNSRNFEYKNLESIYTEINELKLNCKGVAFSKIVQTKVRCLAKDINNTNLYFGNGNKIINVHGNDKVTNKFVAGNSYILIGALSMHNFRPSLEYVDAYVLDEDIIFDDSNFEIKSASDFYKYTYETDKNDKYLDYSKMFESPYIVEGYLNSYIKDNKEYIVLEDQYNENYYSTYQNARDAKAVFFVNENYVQLTSSNSKYCPVYDYLELGTKLKVVVFPYLWNTQKYPQVYCYNFSVI